MALFGRRQKQAETIRRILIVEDEPLVAFDNEYVLRDAGYEVVASVDTVPDAVDAIRTHPLDLVLADVSLSDGGTGLDVAHAARDLNVPVIFVTGAFPSEARPLAIGVLAKPFNQRDLLAAIDAVATRLAGGVPKRVPRSFTLFDA